MPKLVAIGDSLTQGVMNGAISRTKLSYPALIAEAMGLTVRSPGDGEAGAQHEFWVPKFHGNGLPLNIEALLRAVGPDFNNNIGTAEWDHRIASILGFIEKTETSYNSGAADHEGPYHNLAVSGFKVSDSFTVNYEYCQTRINNENGEDDRFSKFRTLAGILKHSPPEFIGGFANIVAGLSNIFIRDSLSEARGFSRTLLGLFLDALSDAFEGSSSSKYRIAQHVLKPNQDSESDTCTQIGNLRYFTRDDPIENLILFLGANDCLGTVRDLEINEDNLTSTDAFSEHYESMVNLISKAISSDTQVFVGTVPHVTIPPITQGIGTRIEINGSRYFSYYVPFSASGDSEFPSAQTQYLTGEQAKEIDDRIDEFNGSIRQVIEQVPNRKNWHVVDICDLLDTLAVKRAEAEEDPGRPIRDFLPCDHDLLGLAPIPNVLRFKTDERNKRTEGGLFSLDCFHPTTIGYGLIAEKFACAMKGAGVRHIDPDKLDWNLDWEEIMRQDTLIQQPPELWDDTVKFAEKHIHLTHLIHRLLT